MVLNPKKILKLVQNEGLLSSKLKNFEERKEQLSMLECVTLAFNENKYAFIEAGTGVGKSLAYLLPAIFAADQKMGKTVISTHTITLQEQLLNKDIPFILDVLGISIEAVLVKGMSNYLCLRKLYDLLDLNILHTLSEREELQKIENWSRETTDGSISDLKRKPKSISWDKLSCESDACSFIKCPQYKECFFYKARKKVKDAQLLVVNHHLLLADLKAKEDDAESESILPKYDYLILDEAHTFEDIATSSLAQHLSLSYILRKFTDLVSDKTHTGKLQLVESKLKSFSEELEVDIYLNSLLEIFTQKKDLQNEVYDAFIAFSDLIKHWGNPRSIKREKISLTPEIIKSQEFLDITQCFIELIDSMHRFSEGLQLFTHKLSDITNARALKALQSLIVDLDAIAQFFNKSASIIKDFFSPTLSGEKIYIVDIDSSKTFSSIGLQIIHLNIADVLSEQLFYPVKAAILCSATLCHASKFNFVQKQLGFKSSFFHPKRFSEKMLPSPFNYQDQVLLAIATDTPMPQDYGYIEHISSQIKSACISSKGGAFVLFTSYKMLEECYANLMPFLIEQGLLPLKQGNENRSTLLNIFKENSNSVLFGTDTFWEGIDVPGFHLRLVIITKLPFPVPTEPIFKAKCDQIEKEGLNSFMDYSIPKALVKFKQGFGRLIRNHKDTGCIYCLDSRLVNKFYGKIFLQSLPKCKQAFYPSNQLHLEIDKFYKEIGDFIHSL